MRRDRLGRADAEHMESKSAWDLGFWGPVMFSLLSMSSLT